MGGQREERFGGSVREWRSRGRGNRDGWWRRQ